MMLRRCVLFSLFATLVPLLGLSAASGADDAVLATIGGAPVNQSAFDQYVQSGWANVNAEVIHTNAVARQKALEVFFDLQVMLAKARQDGLDKSLNYQKAAELMEMKLLLKAITERDRAKLAVEAGGLSKTNQQNYLETLKLEVGLKPTALATNDAPLVLAGQIATNALLATIGRTPIQESDFEWFLKDAFRAEQRPYVFSQPGARKRLVASYLVMRVLEAKARQDGLDQTAAFKSELSTLEAKLLIEFLQERDRVMPWQLPDTDAAKLAAMKGYLQKLRADVKFAYPAK